MVDVETFEDEPVEKTPVDLRRDSESSLYRYTPRLLEIEVDCGSNSDDDDRSSSDSFDRYSVASNRSRSSHSRVKVGVDFASRFLEESLVDDDDKEHTRTSNPRITNSQHWVGHLADTSTNVWSQERHHNIRIDQSINLMDAETGNYSSPKKTRSQSAWSVLFPFQQLKASDRPSHPHPFQAREAKPLVDITDFNNGDGDHPQQPSDLFSTRLFRKNGSGRRIMALIFVAMSLVLLTTLLAFSVFPSHQENLFRDDATQTNNDTPELPLAAGEIPSDRTGTSSQETIAQHREPKDDNSDTVEASEQNTQYTIKASDDSKETLLDTSDVPQTSRLNAIQYFLDQLDVSDPNEFIDTRSAQSQALHWIADKDAGEILIPGFDTSPNPHDTAHLAHLLQRYGLAVLYFSMQAGSDQNLRDQAGHLELENRMAFDSNWTSPLAICKWNGVLCNAGYVVSIELGGSLLEGTIPQEIVSGRTLPMLSILDLSHNNIHGSLPSIRGDPSAAHAIMQLESAENSLERLHLSHNKLSSNLEALADLPNLIIIDIGHNSFGGSIPDTLVPPFFLFSDYLADTFSLDHNLLVGPIPTSLGSLTSVTRFLLDGNQLTGTVPSEACLCLLVLEKIHLFHNHLEGDVPNELCQLDFETLITDCKSGNITCDCCVQCF